MRELRQYPDKHKRLLRLTPECFDEILQLIREDITKQDTFMRKAISPEARLAITLYYMATGSSYCNIHLHFRIGESTAHYIIKEVTEAIGRRVGPIYLKQPQTESEWKVIADG